MNKNNLIIGSIFMLTLTLMTWSCKDSFTEEDQLKLQADLQSKLDDKNSKDSIALSIQVYNASVTAGTAGGRTSSTKGLSGIDVKLTYNGKTETKTSDESGIVSFFVKPGSVSGTLSKTGFTTVNFTLSATRPANTLDHLTNASISLPVFATSGASVSTVKGNVTYEGDLLNNTRESVPDGKVKITFSPTQASLESYYSSTVNTVNADVDKYSIESAFTASVTGGKFNVDLPTGAGDVGLSYTYQFSDFEADQKIAINNFENNPNNSSIKRDVATISTQFTTVTLTNSVFTAIPAVSPVKVDIAPPPPAGTGAVFNLKLVASSVDAGNGITVIASGSGYEPNATNIPVTVVGGDFDNTVPGATPAVLFGVSDADGKIISIQIAGGPGGTKGFGYRSQATLTVGGSGTGAIVRPEYRAQIAPIFGTGINSGSSITSGGTGYVVAPQLIIKGVNNVGNSIQLIADTQIFNGQVVQFSFTPVPANISRINSVTVLPAPRFDAIPKANVTVSSTGEITPAVLVGTLDGLVANAINASGGGYDPLNPPTITIKDLREASPTPAVWGATMNGGGLNALFAINRGSGYSTLTNANFPLAAVSFSSTGVASGTALRPGVTYTLNGHYGTGIKSQGVQ